MIKYASQEQKPESSTARSTMRPAGKGEGRSTFGSARGRMGVQLPSAQVGAGQESRQAGSNMAAVHAAMADKPRGSEPCGVPAPASITTALPSRAGEPLPAGVRSQAEGEFGRSFAGVRVHADREAHRMADSVHARAFTMGEQIVFRAGQYAPGTKAGRDLLRHELGHVAAPESRGAGMVMRAPLYDRTGYTISRLAKSSTLAWWQSNVAAKISNGDLKSGTVKGATPGSEAEIYLNYLLWALGEKTRWDTFIRLEIPIALADTTDPAPPTGLATVTIDDQGNAVAELIQAAPLKRPTATTAADAKAKLKKDYGVGAVEKGDKEWTDAELTDVVASFALLPAADRAAVRGVHLLRYASLGSAAGIYNAGGGHDAGATEVKSPATLKLDDDAFSATSLIFGDVAHQAPASFQTILHEVGHAVEKATMRQAQESYEKAAIERNKKYKQYTAAKEKYEKEYGKYKDDRTQWDRLKKLATDRDAKATATNDAQSKADKLKGPYEATMVPASATKPLETTASTRKTACEQAWKTTRAAADLLAEPEKSAAAQYRTEIEAVQTLLKAYANKVITDKTQIDDAEDDKVIAAITRRNAERDKLSAPAPGSGALATFAAMVAAQDEWFDAARTLGHTYRRTRRLQNFVDMVNKAGIKPFTQYARDNWPYEPEEFYAESYSLWLLDPEFLKANYKPVFDFFETGAHRK